MLAEIRRGGTASGHFPVVPRGPGRCVPAATHAAKISAPEYAGRLGHLLFTIVLCQNFAVPAVARRRRGVRTTAGARRAGGRSAPSEPEARAV